jgi:hypothetical protein
MDDLQKLVETLAIHTLMAKRVRCIDEKDWAGLEECYAENALSHSFQAEGQNAGGLVGAKAIAQSTAKVLENITTAHQVHTPEIEFQSATQATGIWPLNDVLSREQDGKRTWMHAYGHYRQSYEKIAGRWQITEHRLTRLLVETGTEDVVPFTGW